MDTTVGMLNKRNIKGIVKRVVFIMIERLSGWISCPKGLALGSMYYQMHQRFISDLRLSNSSNMLCLPRVYTCLNLFYPWLTFERLTRDFVIANYGYNYCLYTWGYLPTDMVLTYKLLNIRAIARVNIPVEA